MDRIAYKIYIFTFVILCLFAFSSTSVHAEPNSSSDLMGMGLPIGSGSEAPEFNLCPEGANVVRAFMAAWKHENYQNMYSLVDDASKENYPYDEAKFDFQFMEYKPYKISSIRRFGEDFEFILSYGDWKDGDKETKKVLVSGKTFKIIKGPGNSFFRASADSYF